MLRSFLMLAAFFGFTGVALGAFAAHGLKNRLTADYLAIFHTGVTYQLVHALAIFGVAVLSAHLPGRLVGWAGPPGPGLGKQGAQGAVGSDEQGIQRRVHGDWA